MNLRYVIRDGEKVLQECHLEYSFAGNLAGGDFTHKPKWVWRDRTDIPTVDEETGEEIR